tara:strand:+ start:2961 stop:4106 length:1146 start_codon:yes stop_codon:yes gene_type:complete
MIKWIYQNGIVLYLVNTFLLSIHLTFNFGYNIFLIIMVLYTILLLINPQQFKLVILHRAFHFLLILTGLNILYLIVFDNISNLESLKYLSARTIQFTIIPLSIFYNYEYYKDKFLTHLVFIIFGIVLLGIFLDPFLLSGRYDGIIWNPNALASFTVIAFGILLLKNKEKSNLDYILLIVFLIVSLATGSRGVLVGISLAYVFRYGFSFRNVLYAVLSIMIYLLLLNLNFDTSLNRIGSQSLFNDRTIQYYYAIETFLQKPISGWGLSKYSFLNMDLVPYHLLHSGAIISAHNAYLAIIVQYGLIFSSFLFYIIFSKGYEVLYYFRKPKVGYPVIYSYLIIYTLIASIYENLITGINEFHTILFWFSLAILSYSKSESLNAD